MFLSISEFHYVLSGSRNTSLEKQIKVVPEMHLRNVPSTR